MYTSKNYPTNHGLLECTNLVVRTKIEMQSINNYNSYRSQDVCVILLIEVFVTNHNLKKNNV